MQNKHKILQNWSNEKISINEIIDNIFDLINILCKDPVFLGKRNKIPYIIMCKLQQFAALQRPA